jgi:ribosome biogenesis GTPase A
MGKSGPNLESAAEIVGSDVINGKIRWWIEPTKTMKKTKTKK